MDAEVNAEVNAGVYAEANAEAVQCSMFVDILRGKMLHSNNASRTTQ